MVGTTNSNIAGYIASAGNGLEIVSWGGGSLKQISKMLDAHYNGDINLANYWKVGDTRNETLEPIPAGTTGEAQPFQTITLRVIGFNHDELENKIGNRSRSAVTIMVSDRLSVIGYMNSGYDDKTLYGFWSSSERRTWCNKDFLNTMSDAFIKLIKPSIKLSNKSGDRSNIEKTVDKVFLLSSSETTDIGTIGIGDQYEYFKELDNKKWNGSECWTRTSYRNLGNSKYDDWAFFEKVGYDGDDYRSSQANGNFGICPAFCL